MLQFKSTPFQPSLRELDQFLNCNWKELEKLVLTDHLDKSGTTKETKEEDSRRKEKLPRKTDLLKYLNVLSLFLFSTLFGTICVIKLSVFSLFT